MDDIDGGDFSTFLPFFVKADYLLFDCFSGFWIYFYKTYCFHKSSISYFKRFGEFYLPK